MLHEEAAAVMRRTGWLSRQPPEFQDRVLAAVELRRFPAGATIYTLGDPPGDIWGLVDGELSVLIAPEAATPGLVHIATPGWWVGEAALITETPRRADLTARRDSLTMRLPRAAIERMAADDAETWRRLAQITVGHLDHALSVIAGLTMGDTRARVAMTLRRLADLEGERGAAAGTLRVSQEELGEMTRLNRNAVAQILAELAVAGLVERRYRRLKIPDLAALARYIDARVTNLDLLPTIG